MMTPEQFRWNVLANLTAALIVFIIATAFYFMHERAMQNRGDR